jgi:hypothetical protein
MRDTEETKNHSERRKKGKDRSKVGYRKISIEGMEMEWGKGETRGFSLEG